MQVLVIGGGGREHALAWKLAASPRVERVYVAPGNAGTALEPGIENLDIAVDDFAALLDFAQRAPVDLTVVGPEAPLAAGVVDAFEARGLRCFGPSRLAAELEGSKAFAKDFMARHEIPSAAHRHFEDLSAAEAYIRERGAPLVVKADGLAAGKGVVVAQDVDTALAAAEATAIEHVAGSAGRRIVVEDFLPGEEVSFIVLADGLDVLPLASSQDHKARDDGDRGPNTGGMGAYSPAPVLTPELHDTVMEQVIRPTLHALAVEDRRYRGFLYAGLMIGPDGVPRVLEFNCRLGDPETQPLLLRLRSDLAALCEAALDGKLAECSVDWDPRPAVGVVLAAGGYPGDYARGAAIDGLDQAVTEHGKVFHAGTALRDDRVVTDGGRVLCATALGDDLQQACDHAYELAAQVRWEGVFYRRDIGHRALQRGAG